uniref:Oxaloacetate tautomerase FAHD1, mitochondrial n=1 Tax=Trichuris muris TaxID=70415 RepID=A0A5S6QTQ5_TRIMR
MNCANARNFRKYGKKIVAVLRNYRDHAAEMGQQTMPTVPAFFLKPTSAFVEEGESVIVPRGCAKLQHEVELGVVIAKRASKITLSNALDFVAGYALALDMTARDFQEDAKSKGYPWTLSKGFDTSCPVSRFISTSELPDPENVDLWCKVNNVMKQQGNSSNMFFSIARLIEYITEYITLEEGDVILTGTPAGVSTVSPGDVMECGLGNIVTMRFHVK